MSQKVAVGLSGGIDSAMAAKLLLESGYDVIGITMSIYDPSSSVTDASRKGCYGPNEALSLKAARRVADAIGIPHHIIDLREAFSHHVLDYYRQTWLVGQTPNPCAQCNAFIKFGLLPHTAREQGIAFDFFATGHYVRRRQDLRTGRWQLYKGLDPSKDQSYFLSLLKQEQLAHTLFPLGEHNKAQVKQMAAERGLDFLVSRAESQDFIQSEDHSALFEADSISSGEMVDASGKLMGRHRGLIHYTIGQRKGLGISGQSEPVFVTGIDARKNRVIIGSSKELLRRELFALDMNWLSIAAPAMPSRAQARIRQQHQAAACTLEQEDSGTLKIVFDEPQLSITPGQIVALYLDDLLLGGAVIAAKPEI